MSRMPETSAVQRLIDTLSLSDQVRHYLLDALTSGRLRPGDRINEAELARWTQDVTRHTFIHENVRKRFMEGFHHDAHPMGILVSTLAALSTFYPDAKDIFGAESRHNLVYWRYGEYAGVGPGAHGRLVSTQGRMAQSTEKHPEKLRELVDIWNVLDAEYARQGATGADPRPKKNKD